MKAAIAAGVVIGTLYTLSPLTLGFAVALVPLWTLASRGVSARERRWLAGIFAAAIVLRLVALAGLFLSAGSEHPFVSFFGDEDLFKSRSVWLRNIGLGIPISKADFIYTFDDVGQSAYQPLLAYLQALVGDAPYGVHLFNAGLYLGAVLALYRLIRAAFGGVAAMASLTGLLFVPSLFAWSISALKEPLHLTIAMTGLLCTVQVSRAPRGWMRLASAGAVVAIAVMLESLRVGGFVMTVIGTAGGFALAALLTRPRWLAAVACAVLIAVAVPTTRHLAQRPVVSALRVGAFQHAGHVATAGYTYQLIPSEYYEDRSRTRVMPPGDAVRFGIKATIAYLTVPLPWRIESRSMLAYLPEHLMWYLLLLLAPVGVVAGLRRDVLVTSLLLTHAFAAVMLVALTGGNVGTLIRHRGLALPYILCLAAVGAHSLLRRAAR